MKVSTRTAVVWTLMFTVLQWQSAGSAQSEESDAPSFTKKQATQGRKAYREHCATCHGAKLEGVDIAPGMSGVRFDYTWRGKTAGNLATHIRRMPPEAVAEPGSIDEKTFTDIQAFILMSNGLPVGDAELSVDMEDLNDLVIPLLPGMDEDPDVPIATPAELAAHFDEMPEITDDMMRNPSPNDWIHWGRTYDGQSYSPLDQINKDNVKDLKEAWHQPLRWGLNMPVPLVYNGVMYLHTHPDTVLAVDGANGNVLWRYQREGLSRSARKMGIGLHGHTVFVPTSDNHVVALNAKNGEVIWDHAISFGGDPRAGRRFHLRSAPIIIEDKVIQGVTGGGPGGAFIFAMDINTGEELWRFHTIARPDAPQGNTWNGLALNDRSGGSVWQFGTYDTELGLLYFGVAPTYDTGPLLNPIDDDSVSNEAMYTNCTVALDPDNGELVWFYQHMQNDQWDLDWCFERQLATFEVDGKPRRVVMNVGKIVMMDALDAATGEFLFSVDTGVQNIISAVDPETGAKTFDPLQIPNPERSLIVCPSAYGARSWPPTAYSPRTKFSYIPIAEGCMSMTETSDRREMLSSGTKLGGATHPDDKDGLYGRIQAIDLEKQELAWAVDQERPPSTGLLTTGGGLLFSGDIDPSLKAFDDATGELLWEGKLNQSPSSTVISYMANGKQYVAVVLGLSNNHIRDITSGYNRHADKYDLEKRERPENNASIRVFALD